jgi:hypothetical protein
VYDGPAVFATEQLHEKAKALYPSGGSVEGIPTYELFVKGPLAAAALAFEVQLRRAPGARPRIHEEVTPSPFFGPLVFFGIVGSDYAEIRDFENDPGYFELVEADPRD